MKFPKKDEWSEIALIGIIGGGFSCGIGLLYRLGFDKNATFTFLGAVVGAAAAVLLSIGQQERQHRRAADREREKILAYFQATRSLLDAQLASLINKHQDALDISQQEGRNIAGCWMAQGTIENLRRYTVQAVRYAEHLGFLARAQLDGVIEQCDQTLIVLQKIVAEADALDGRPDYESGRRSIRNLHNSMCLLPDF